MSFVSKLEQRGEYLPLPSYVISCRVRASPALAMLPDPVALPPVSKAIRLLMEKFYGTTLFSPVIADGENRKNSAV